MVKKLTMILGWVFVIVGVLGFVPGITNNEMLLGIFRVNALHNIIHLLSGAAAIYAASVGYKSARMYAQIFGIVYALVAILGFVYGDNSILGIVSSNMADTWLHVVLAVVILYLGFGTPADDK